MYLLRYCSGHMFGFLNIFRWNSSKGLFKKEEYSSVINIKERLYVSILNCLLESKDLKVFKSFYEVRTLGNILGTLYRILIDEKVTDDILEWHHIFSKVKSTDECQCNEEVEYFLDKFNEYYGGINLMTLRDIKNKNRKTILETIGFLIEKAINKATEEHYTNIGDVRVNRVLKRVKRGSGTWREDTSLTKVVKKYFKGIVEVEKEVSLMDIRARTNEEKEKAKCFKILFIRFILALYSKENEDFTTVEEKIQLQCAEEFGTIYRKLDLLEKKGTKYILLNEKNEMNTNDLDLIPIIYNPILHNKRKNMYKEIIRLVDN